MSWWAAPTSSTYQTYNLCISFNPLPNMPRFHLLEFEDQRWFPKIIRNYMTDFLQFVTNQFDLFKASVPILQKGLDKSGETQGYPVSKWP